MLAGLNKLMKFRVTQNITYKVSNQKRMIKINLIAIIMQHFESMTDEITSNTRHYDK